MAAPSKGLPRRIDKRASAARVSIPRVPEPVILRSKVSYTTVINERVSGSSRHAPQDIAADVCLDTVSVTAVQERAVGEQKCQQDTYRRDWAAKTNGDFPIEQDLETDHGEEQQNISLYSGAPPDGEENAQ